MLLTGRLPLSSLIELCRALRHSLLAGLTLRDSFRMQAKRGPMAVRPIAERIRGELEQGTDLEAALQREEIHFPPLFLALATVGERTGNLPEVFEELEKYFVLQQKLFRRFLMMIAWPVFQLVAAIFVIAALLWLLGLVASMTNSEPLDPLGFGLTGTPGAIVWLVACFGLLAAPFVLYLVLGRLLRQQAILDRVLLAIPVVGPCVRALALSRFCLALRLTMETGMPIHLSAGLSLRATGNGAYQDVMRSVKASLRSGDELHVSLQKARVFPADFVDIVAVAEEAGRVPEVMQQQSERYETEAATRMTVLTAILTVATWLGIGALIIWAIFQIFVRVYLGTLDRLAS